MTNWQKSIISLAFLTVMLLIAFQQTQAPAAKADSDLDYETLLGHVNVIAARPHPMGSVENARVRDYVVSYFKSLGLQTEVQKTTVVYRHPFKQRGATIIANVENIIARLPGRSVAGEGQGDDLVLMAHYDSRPLTPGAADDASGTATLMEVARLMAAGPKPLHDVVFLVTDGEEMGLLGAQGFFRQHPAAKRVGMVLDFEARGSYGASAMFETSEQNAWLIDNLIESAPDLVANSLSYEIYRRMPNDTDMSISKGEGIPGLNFAFVSGLADYHAATDTPQNLDKDTLAHQANYALATARHFAMLEEWKRAGSDKTYFNLWQGAVVSYSQTLAIALGLLVLVLGLWVLVSARRSGALKLPALGNGLIAIIVLVLIVSNLFESIMGLLAATPTGIDRVLALGEWPLMVYCLLTLGISVWFAAALRRGFTVVETWVVTITLAAIGLLAGRPWPGVVVLVLILASSMLYLRKRTSIPDAWAAALLLWWLLAAVMLYVAPNGSYLLIWPLASVLPVFAVSRRRSEPRSPVPLLITLAGSFVPLLLLLPLIIMAYLALGTALPQAIMILVALAFLLTWPLIQNMDSTSRGNTGLFLFLAGAAITVLLFVGRDFDERHPLGESLFYAYDGDQDKGFWVSPDAVPGTWLNDFLGKNAQTFNLDSILPGYDRNVLIRRNDIDGVQLASVVTRSDRLVDGKRELRLSLQSPSAAEYINLLFPLDVGIASATVNGFDVKVPGSSNGPEIETSKPDADKNRDKGDVADWWRWRWYGLPASGAEIVLTMKPDHALKIKIVEVDYGLPPGSPSRPVGSAPKPYTWSDSRVLFQSIDVD